MRAIARANRILGVAFLLQFATSFASSVLLRRAWYVPEEMGATLTRITQAAMWFLGVIFLGAMLYVTLESRNRKVALTALGFYVLEAAMLATSRAGAFALLRISEAYAGTQAAALATTGQMVYDTMEFLGGTLHMLAFCMGAILFYTLLVRARIVPRALALWGLIAVIPCLLATVLAIFGYEVPFWVYLPYVPFELAIGLWIVFAGVREPALSDPAQASKQPRPAWASGGR
jgi:hypothetical protein